MIACLLLGFAVNSFHCCINPSFKGQGDLISSELPSGKSGKYYNTEFGVSHAIKLRNLRQTLSSG